MGMGQAERAVRPGQKEKSGMDRVPLVKIIAVHVEHSHSHHHHHHHHHQPQLPPPPSASSRHGHRRWIP